MRLGIDARALHGDLTGIGNYTWNLLNQLPELIPNIQLYAYLPTGYNCSIPPTLKSIIFKRSKALPLMSGHIWLKFHAGSLIRKDALDVFWSPRTLLPSGITAFVPTLCTVHDLNSILFPKTMKTTNLFAHKVWFKKDILKSTSISTISNGTSLRLKSIIGRKADAVISPGVDDKFRPNSKVEIDFVRNKYSLHTPYLLFVGTLEPRKNLEQLLLAHEQVNASKPFPLQLVIVGKRGWKNQKLIIKLESGLPNVRELGFVQNEDLPALYSGAEALVIPSLYEGYGMPAAEAMSCGTRVIATDIPELREAGGPKAVYCQPTVEGIAKGINQALQSPRPINQFRHSWKLSAMELAILLKDTAEKTKLKF
jgi:glycosyltransferase involved in cell wall biosynthesis